MKEAYYRYGICRDCKRRQIVRLKDWARTPPPRCSACGGMLDPSSKAKEEELLERSDAARDQKEQLRKKQGF